MYVGIMANFFLQGGRNTIVHILFRLVMMLDYFRSFIGLVSSSSKTHLGAYLNLV